MKQQLLSILLVFTLVIGIVPNSVFANDVNAVGVQKGETVGEIAGSQIISDMIEKSGLNIHPRIIMSEEKFAKLKSHIDDGSVTATLLKRLRSEADELLEADVSEYVIPDGIRLLETSRQVQRRVAILALAYNIFDEEEYAIRCYTEMEAACEFKDWNPYHFLDTAEMSAAFAYGYDWLYNWMNDEQRTLIRTNMIEKGLKQVMDDYEDNPRSRSYCWYQDYPGDNWKLVCNGSMSMAALAIGDEAEAKEISAKVLTYAYKEAYGFVRRAYSEKDGTYSEGLGYWDYATYFLGLYSSSLTSATGTDYGLADHEGLRKSVDFIRYMSSNTSTSFSFGDDGDSRQTDWSVLQWLGGYFDSPEISAIRLKKIAKDSFNYLDVLWIDEDKQVDSEKKIPTDWGAVGASNASFRNTWDKSGIVAALHAGKNDYKYHGHYDLGSFYVESNGSRFFTDLGNEYYELPKREYSYRIRAEGHNTLVINPSETFDQRNGVECLITHFDEGEEAFAVTDLTEAYQDCNVKSVVRGLKMIKEKECVVIQDEIQLKDAGEIYWFAHTKGQIDVAEDGRSAIVTVGEDRLWVGLVSEGGSLSAMKAESLSTTPVVENQADNSSYRKLAVHLTDAKTATISVVCIPLEKDETTPSWTPTLTTIAEWIQEAEKNSAEKDGSTSEIESDKNKTEVSKNQVIVGGQNVAGTTYVEMSKVKTTDIKEKLLIFDQKSKGKYKISKITKKNGKIVGGTVTYMAPYSKNSKTASIKTTLKIAGVSFKITAIEKNAFKNNKKLTKVTIGSNISKIGKSAFYGCKKLKSITIRSKKLKTSTVGAKAFGKINVKAKAKVPKSKEKAYKKLLKKKGMNGKKQKVVK